MSQIRTTYQIAAPQIKEYVMPLEAGANAMPFDIRDEHGRMLNFHEDYLSGKFLFLLFINSQDEAVKRDCLKQLSARQDQIQQMSATVVAVTANNARYENIRIKQQANFIWPVTDDPAGSVFAAYGLHKLKGDTARLVLLTPQRQVRAWFDSPQQITPGLDAMTEMIKNQQSQEDARWSACHAPVLHVPNVLTARECQQVIASFESANEFLVRPPHKGEVAGNYKVPVYEHNRQDRVDQLVRDKQMLEFLDQRIWGRITPMIQKAFAFNVTRREELHIARYEGARSGHHMGHRDNSAAGGFHRRFALSLALNDDYDGGELTFNEFSPHGYRPSRGTALVFSSSLLHEVSEITSGRRYNLVSNLFNEDSLAKT
jgi:predicted 2-oxoglutarate/Fe(II)-dependent dioxygenase YbiX/peroxiredoxin